MDETTYEGEQRMGTEVFPESSDVNAKDESFTALSHGSCFVVWTFYWNLLTSNGI